MTAGEARRLIEIACGLHDPRGPSVRNPLIDNERVAAIHLAAIATLHEDAEIEHRLSAGFEREYGRYRPLVTGSP